MGIEQRVAFVALFLGRQLEYVYEIVELIPGERLSCSPTASPSLCARPTLKPVGGGQTRMTAAQLGPAERLRSLRRQGDGFGHAQRHDEGSRSTQALLEFR